MSGPTPPCTTRWLPYVAKLARRDAADIELVVIHCTELPDLATAREYGERIHYDESGTGNSGHYYVDRDGTVEEWVPPDRVAHHCRGHNERSIGIELVNRGRYPAWFDSRHQDMNEAYPAAQVAALVALLRALAQRLPALARIAGHEDLDRDEVEASDDPRRRVRRKRDPGPRFPWAEVLGAVALERQAPAPPRS